MTLEDKGKSMFERFFKGDQKEAIMTTEKMLAGELRTPKGLYFDNLKTIVTVLFSPSPFLRVVAWQSTSVPYFGLSTPPGNLNF